MMQDDFLSEFYLVGGTALALLLGHRQSIDLDLFTTQNFDIEVLKSHLIRHYDYHLDKTSGATLIGHIDGIKVDCIRYEYPLINSLIEEDNIRMASSGDIAAMKLTAISQSGNRLKDFVDIAFLSEKMSLNDMLSVFEKKYPQTDVMTAIRGLIYFEDIDFSVSIITTGGVFRWKEIEKRLLLMVKHPDRIFLSI
jgi:hypothetical protein